MRGSLSKNSSITCEFNSFCFRRILSKYRYFSWDQILRKCAFRLKIDYRIVKPSDNRCWNPRPIPITIVYYRNQWENVRGVEYFRFQLYWLELFVKLYHFSVGFTRMLIFSRITKLVSLWKWKESAGKYCENTGSHLYFQEVLPFLSRGTQLHCIQFQWH